MDQKENQSDINITANIRQSVMKAPDMSTNGQNVKIITADGVVTLRGPVASEAEKSNISTYQKQKDAETAKKWCKDLG